MPGLLDRLSAPARTVVTHEGGPLLARGGAGTGKTEALVRRMAWLLERDHAPESVLLVLPRASRRGELRGRLAVHSGADAERVGVATPGELAERLLREHALEAGLDPFFATLSRADRLALLLDHLDELTLRHHPIRGNPAALLGGLLARVDALKATRAPAPRAHADADGGALEAEFDRFCFEHDRLLAEAGALDHGDLVLHASALLDRSAGVRAGVAARHPTVLCDDLPELSPAGCALVLRLAGDGGPTATADEHAGLDGAGAQGPAAFRERHPEAPEVRLERSYRLSRPVAAAAAAVVAPLSAGGQPVLRGSGQAGVRLWRCANRRAEAQAVAAEAERLLESGVAPDAIGVVVPTLGDEAREVAGALDERGVPVRLAGAAAYFQRAEVRDVLAWLRLLADPGDAGAVVRALSRPPVDLRSVDIARLTQLARRRKVDMVTGVAAALDGPQLSPEGRERAAAFLKLYDAASEAFAEMRPDAFVHRLIERIGLRRQQVFADRVSSAERLVNIAKLGELAQAYARRGPEASSRDFARYVTAMAEAGLPEDEVVPERQPGAVQVLTAEAARGYEFEHAFVLGLSAAGTPGDAAGRRALYVAMTRARRGLVLAWSRGEGEPRPSPLLEEVRSAIDGEEEPVEEELFGPGEGLHATFLALREELLADVPRIAGQLDELRLDTYLEVSRAVARYLELVKVAALIERAEAGQALSPALAEVNERLLQGASADQRQLFLSSGLDELLLGGGAPGRPGGGPSPAMRAEPSLDPFIPRRGEGLMLSASDIETYRLCPLKYKFARVFRIPQEPTINQRFGILVHQVLERYHSTGGGSLEYLMHLFAAGWRRAGFGDANDDLQFRDRARRALRRYWERDQADPAEPVWFEKGFAFTLGPHLLRGRVDRVDRMADGGLELIDYKTGRARTAEQLRDDVQLSLYQLGARESWGVEAAAGSYLYVLDGEKVPVRHSEEELERVRGTVATIAEGIDAHRFEPRPAPDLCAFCDYRIICPAAEK